MLILKKIKFLSDISDRRPLCRCSKAADVVTRASIPRYGRRLGWVIVFLATLGCGPSRPERADDYLIRLEELKVTRHEFLQAFELVKAAHPGCGESESSELQQARRQLLDEMSVGLMMIKRSQELGITVSTGEVEAAVAAVKADYPPGVFEQGLVEAALPFHAWKQRVHSRLLMEKLMDIELRPHITITAGDISAYYERNYKGKAAEAVTEQKFERLKELLVVDLRRAMMEEAFDAWIGGLKNKHPVEVNAPLWSRITESGPQDVTLPGAPAEPAR